MNRQAATKKTAKAPAPTELKKPRVTMPKPKAEPTREVARVEPQPPALEERKTLVPFTPEWVELVRSTIAPKLSAEQFELFLYLCKRRNLDPFLKQIIPVVRRERQDDSYVERVVFQTSIDAYRLIADRTGHYAPGKATTFTYRDDGKGLVPWSATAYVMKLVQGAWLEVSATVFMREYKPSGTGSFMWDNKPHVMLGKCAEAVALRRAFPEDLSNLYVDEEMEQADSRREAEQPARVAKPEEPKKLEPAKAESDVIDAEPKADVGGSPVTPAHVSEQTEPVKAEPETATVTLSEAQAIWREWANKVSTFKPAGEMDKAMIADARANYAIRGITDASAVLSRAQAMKAVYNTLVTTKDGDA